MTGIQTAGSSHMTGHLTSMEIKSEPMSIESCSAAKSFEVILISDLMNFIFSRWTRIFSQPNFKFSKKHEGYKTLVKIWTEILEYSDAFCFNWCCCLFSSSNNKCLFQNDNLFRVKVKARVQFLRIATRILIWLWWNLYWSRVSQLNIAWSTIGTIQCCHVLVLCIDVPIVWVRTCIWEKCSIWNLGSSNYFWLNWLNWLHGLKSCSMMRSHVQVVLFWNSGILEPRLIGGKTLTVVWSYVPTEFRFVKIFTR